MILSEFERIFLQKHIEQHPKLTHFILEQYKNKKWNILAAPIEAIESIPGLEIIWRERIESEGISGSMILRFKYSEEGEEYEEKTHIYRNMRNNKLLDVYFFGLLSAPPQEQIHLQSAPPQEQIQKQEGSGVLGALGGAIGAVFGSNKKQ